MSNASTFGPALGRISDDRFTLVITLRKTTAEKFSIHAIETMAEIHLVDSLPLGIEINYEKPVTRVWAEEFVQPPGQILVQITAFVKESVRE